MGETRSSLGEKRSRSPTEAFITSDRCRTTTPFSIFPDETLIAAHFDFSSDVPDNTLSDISLNSMSSLTVNEPVNFGDEEYDVEEFGLTTPRKKRGDSCPDLTDLSEGTSQSNAESDRLDLADHGNILNGELCSSKGVRSMTRVVSFPDLKECDQCETANVSCSNNDVSMDRKDPSAVERKHSIVVEVSRSDLIQGKIDPSTFLMLCLKAKGFDPHVISAIQLFDENVFLKPTAEQIAAYDNDVIGAVRAEDIPKLECMHKSGRTLQCSNRFGESILHTACRCGLTSAVAYMVEEAGVSVKCADDFGRTPMHDACWAVRPSIELTEILLKAEPGLLLVTDKRGQTPLQYARRELWGFWCTFLDERKHLLLPLDHSS
eukprot:CAMPEP_0194278670 /NCGR_PEP_ID=MMETSP0169-20130528/11780_1 /TAXON_ID=218684 /ORGANISM="Corethron pennatum, Strain L29A3" /LENGTH=375 /DNA_ID=CAMNT_0039022905 /DNA_START=276 /DNA_END=1406 /DNA_ORIENTATION=+